ncbi:MAG TPA: methyltransferase domain-containing protein [Blastocatellia bacterium]|nr:methyltransferase domain-containing protein [Blastocatellia bacterium]
MSQVPASDTLREWRESASYWKKHARNTRIMFSPLTAALVEEAGIREDQTVLDVAGGPGEPSLTIAGVVGPRGSVTCTDAVAEMVAAAESEARRRGLTNLEFRQCAAERLPFVSDSFDIVLSRLGVMFSPEPAAALREMLRVTKPGGALSLAVWGRSELNPYFYIVTRVMSRYVETPPADPAAPGAFRFAEPGDLARLLREAGAMDVRERLLEFRLEAPLSLVEFWIVRSEISGTLREKLETLPSEERIQVAQEVMTETRPFFRDGRMSFPAQAIIVSGRKPSQSKDRPGDRL